MSQTHVKIGVVGCGQAARIHLERLCRLEGVRIVGLADSDLGAAQELAALATAGMGEPAPDVFADHRELIKQKSPDAVAIFTPHLAHYHPAMDALQSGCHVFIEKPLSTHVQEAADIVGLAHARGRKVGVGHQFRLLPSLVEARRRLALGSIGPVRLITALLAQPWLAAHGGAENSWRFDPKNAAGGMLADAGDHLLDALLWSTGQTAVEVAALQNRLASGLDLVTAAAIRLSNGTPVTLALSGVSPDPLFELVYLGERGCLRATDRRLVEQIGDAPPTELELPKSVESVDGNFVAALVSDHPLCCPAEAALDTVRLLDAVARSVASGQVVKLA